MYRCPAVVGEVYVMIDPNRDLSGMVIMTSPDSGVSLFESRRIPHWLRDWDKLLLTPEEWQ